MEKLRKCLFLISEYKERLESLWRRILHPYKLAPLFNEKNLPRIAEILAKQQGINIENLDTQEMIGEIDWRKKSLQRTDFEKS